MPPKPIEPAPNRFVFGCALQIGVTAGVFLMLGSVLSARTSDRDMMRIGCLIASLGIAGCLGMAVAIYVSWFRSNHLRKVLEPFGLKPDAHFMAPIQYFHGLYRGSAVHVTAMRGPVLTLSVESPLATRWSLSEGNWLTRALQGLVGLSQLPHCPQALAHLRATAAEVPWMQWFLTHPVAHQALPLLANPGQRQTRVLFAQPGALRLQFYTAKISSLDRQNVGFYLDGLCAMATALASVQQPNQRIEPGLFDSLRPKFMGFANYMPLISMGISGLMLLGIAGFGSALVLYTLVSAL